MLNTLKKIILLLLGSCVCASAIGQIRLTISNNGYIVIDNSAYVVIDNANSNAVSTISGGNIISENETDVLKWNVGTNTGVFTIPWTTVSGVKIPLAINKTTAGSGASSNFILSTWKTTNVNLPFPTSVTNMNLSTGADGSLFAADRFWHIDASSFTTKPDVTLSINYDATNEIVGTNTITENNLLAQRFNTNTNQWDSLKLFGTNDATSDRVTTIVVPSADFFSDWILIDKSSPLPIKLVDFSSQCQNGRIELNWTTQTEINNDYFIIERSADAELFFPLTEVKGAGNSNTIKQYKIFDSAPFEGTTYYRLKQVDYDGTASFYNIISSNCTSFDFEVNQVKLISNALTLHVLSNSEITATFFLYDYAGKLIKSSMEVLSKGDNEIHMNNIDISSGIYLLSVRSNQFYYSTKIVRQ